MPYFAERRNHILTLALVGSLAVCAAPRLDARGFQPSEKFSEDELPALALKIKSPDEKERAAAAARLRGLWPPESAKKAVPLVIEALKDKSVAVRRAAAQSLDVLPATREAARALFVALDDPDPTVRGDASMAIEVTPECVPELIQALQHKDQGMRARMAERASSLGADGAPLVPHLMKLLDDPGATVRERAAGTLGSIGPASAPAIPRLLEMMKSDPASAARASAGRALSHVGELPASATPLLLEMLKSRDDSNRASAAVMLGSMKRVEAVAGLAEMVATDSSRFNRSLAMGALGQLGRAARAAAPALIQVIEDETKDNQRDYAARALGLVDGPDDDHAVAALVKLAQQPLKRLWYLKSAALDGLGDLGAARPDVLDLLRAAAHDDIPGIRTSALQSLRKLEPAPAPEPAH